jgi:hypothetical protein
MPRKGKEYGREIDRMTLNSRAEHPPPPQPSTRVCCTILTPTTPPPCALSAILPTRSTLGPRTRPRSQARPAWVSWWTWRISDKYTFESIVWSEKNHIYGDEPHRHHLALAGTERRQCDKLPLLSCLFVSAFFVICQLAAYMIYSFISLYKFKVCF